MQNRQPMQRCGSIMTMPSGRLKVAPVGQTRVQGGLEQWLHSARIGWRARSAPRYSSNWLGKKVLARLLPNPLDRVLLVGDVRDIVGLTAGAQAGVVAIPGREALLHINDHRPPVRLERRSRREHIRWARGGQRRKERILARQAGRRQQCRLKQCSPIDSPHGSFLARADWAAGLAAAVGRLGVADSEWQFQQSSLAFT